VKIWQQKTALKNKLIVTKQIKYGLKYTNKIQNKLQNISLSDLG
jgi:hypothetical protein